MESVSLSFLTLITKLQSHSFGVRRGPFFRILGFKVTLHGTIRNDDFKHNIALQYWNNVVTIRNNVATMMLQRRLGLKIVVANCLV